MSTYMNDMYVIYVHIHIYIYVYMYSCMHLLFVDPSPSQSAPHPAALPWHLCGDQRLGERGVWGTEIHKNLVYR